MLLLSLLAVCCVFPACPGRCVGFLPEPGMQVELARSSRLIVSGTGRFRAADGNCSREYASAIDCTAANGGIWAGDRLWNDPLVIEPVDGGLCQIEEHTYRGRIEIRRQGDLVIAVNLLPIEQYLYGISKYEISPDWSFSTLCAHAIASRSYALHKLWEGNGPITNTAHHQVYGGVQGEDPTARIAIDATRGEVLLYDGKVINALYHACSGGYVTSCEDVWGKTYPYLISHPDPFCEQTPYSQWQITLTRDELGAALQEAGLISGELKSMEEGDVDASGRVKYVIVTDKCGVHLVSGQDLREIIGYSLLKSTLFEVDSAGERFVFQGRGWGHGVGMAQWGAAMMGEGGYATDEILDFYYPGTYIARVY